MTLADILAAVATLGDAVGEGLVALALGFAALPTGIGFLIGAILVFAFSSVIPVCFEVESLTVISRLANRDWKRMAYMVLLAGLLGTCLGLLGVYGRIVSFIEGPILSGMMTGVGVILSFVAIDTFKGNKVVGGVSIAAALLAFFILSGNDNNLIYALFISVLAGVIASRFVPFEVIETSAEREKIRLIPFDGFAWLKDIRVIRGALALLALRVGPATHIRALTAKWPGLPLTWTTPTLSLVWRA